MSEYADAYMKATGLPAPLHADGLDQWFDAIIAGDLLPPRSVQAVKAGLIAHALYDSDQDKDTKHLHYYNWVIAHLLGGKDQVRELSAQLIGMAFVSSGVFKTDLPQPLTLNPWQGEAMKAWPLATKRAVIIENNSVFIWLHQLHRDWPLIDQGGNDFQQIYLQLLSAMVKDGLTVTYLGDLDATGIRMADTLRQALPAATEFLAIQSPQRVMTWLGSELGKIDPRRTKAQTVHDPELSFEMNTLTSQQRFVEQEQLLDEYEGLIAEWLAQP